MKKFKLILIARFNRWVFNPKGGKLKRINILLLILILTGIFVFWSEWKIRQPIIKKMWKHEVRWEGRCVGMRNDTLFFETYETIIRRLKPCTLYVYKKEKN
jgi:hypothetical protein